jgi:hypothetical protein
MLLVPSILVRATLGCHVSAVHALGRRDLDGGQYPQFMFSARAAGTTTLSGTFAKLMETL